MRKLNKYKLVPIISMGGMLVLFNLLVFPYIRLQVSAETVTEEIPESKTGIEGSKASLVIADISDVKPDITRGVTTYASKSITIDAKRVSDFTLQIRGKGGENRLTSVIVNPDTQKHDYLTPTSGDIIATNLTENTWGYYYDKAGTFSGAPTNVKYLPIPAIATKIDDDGGTLSYENSYSKTQTKNIYFAANFGQDVVEGGYEAEIELTLTISPKEIVGLESITYMQEMTPEICTATEPGFSRQLIDNRGSTKYSYWVKKESDNNCWMMYNLRLPGGTTITGSDSDLHNAASYTLPSSTSGTFNANVSQQMRNSSGTYAEYYGAWYTWCVATANSCTEANSNNSNYVDVSSSICPKGWKLPRGGLTTGGTNRAVSATDYNSKTSYNDLAALLGYTGSLSEGLNLWTTLSATSSTTNGKSIVVKGTIWPFGGRISGFNGVDESTFTNYYLRSSQRGLGSFIDTSIDSRVFVIAATTANNQFAMNLRCLAYSL